MIKFVCSAMSPPAGRAAFPAIVQETGRQVASGNSPLVDRRAAHVELVSAGADERVQHPHGFQNVVHIFRSGFRFATSPPVLPWGERHRETTPRTHGVYGVASTGQNELKINKLGQDGTFKDPP